VIGALNPLPFRVGGGPTPTSRAYQTLRQAVGKGGSAEDDTGIEGLWRRSEAKGIAAASSHTRRAFIQTNPLFATDLIPYYERILGIVPPAGASDAERRAVIVPRWRRRIDASMPNVARELALIDARFTVLESDSDTAIVSVPGRAFGPLDGQGPPMVLPGDVSAASNYSTEFIVRVRFTLGYAGRPSAADQRLLEAARRLLRELCQSWETFTISTGPWLLGVTPIGLGAVGP
jgi:hypothetical protein